MPHCRFARGLSICLLFSLNWGCGDETAASKTSCEQDQTQCPTGTQCTVDAVGNAFCEPVTPINGQDMLTNAVDMGTGGTSGTNGQGGSAGQAGSTGIGGSGGTAGGAGGGNSGQGGTAGSTNTGGDSGASGNGGTQGNGGNAGSESSCRDVSILLKPSRGVEYTARIMLAVDRSGSVVDWNGWDAITAGITQTIGLLGEGVQFGLTLFPSPTGSVGVREDCRSAQVNQAVGYETQDDILRFLEIGEPRTNQGTPTATAIQAAGDHLLESPTGADYILLVTDGAPNCNAFSNEPNRHASCVCTTTSCFLFDDNYNCLDSERTTQLIARYAQEGIKTIVVGITVDPPSISSIPCPGHRTCGNAQSCSCDTGNGCPGSTTGQCEDELRPTLQAFAQAGGASNNGSFFEVSNINDIQNVITSTAARVRPCTFDLEDIANVNSALNVTIDGNSIPNDPSRTNGWYAENGILTLYGNACESIRDGRAHAISATCD